MRIEILGAESLGVRSLATRVEAGGHTYLIDPGVSVVHKRLGHPPHPVELAAAWNTRRAITSAAQSADAILITHYHHDHFTPFSPDPNCPWLASRTAEELYGRARIFAKHPTESINGSQRTRAQTLWSRADPAWSRADPAWLRADPSPELREPLEIVAAEGAHWHALEGLRAAPHGRRGSRQGFVAMMCLREGDETFVHASDIQLLDPGTVDRLLHLAPTHLLVSGPPVYHPRVSDEEARLGLKQLRRLAERIPHVIVDHHFLRSADYRREGKLAFERARKLGHELVTAAEWMGQRPMPFEALRERLYAWRRVPYDWFELFLAGSEEWRSHCLGLAEEMGSERMIGDLVRALNSR